MTYGFFSEKRAYQTVWSGLFLLFCLLLLPQGAWAATDTTYLAEANTLKSLGLFLGTEKGFELDREATRAESAVMLIRLLGKEPLAKELRQGHPFTDTYAWADPYIGYLYQEHLTNGVGNGLFGFQEVIEPKQYVTFLLRSLGYEEQLGDFSYGTSLEKGLEIGLYDGPQYARLRAVSTLNRGYCVFLSYRALFTPVKDSEACLLEKLYRTDSAVTGEGLIQASKRDRQLADFIRQELGLSADILRLSPDVIYAQASPAAFLIEVYNEQGASLGTGSGFFISEDGRLVTNYHVIEAVHHAEIYLANGEVYPVSSVLGADPRNDLAILQIAVHKDMSYLPIADSNFIENGDGVYAIGSPEAVINTFSFGRITNKRQIVNERVMIEMTAPISSGSSGGALLNEQGEVIGVTTSGVKDEKNVGFAVASNYIGKIPLSSGYTLSSLPGRAYWEENKKDSQGNYHEQEFNDTKKYANEFPPGEVLVGAIDMPEDIDVFHVSLAERTTLFAGVACSTDWHTKNLTLMLLNSQGNILATSQAEHSNQGWVQSLDREVAPGDYYLVLVQNGSVDDDNLWYGVPYYMVYYN